MAVTKPINWTAISEYDTTIHATKLEEREKSAIGNQASKLGLPTSITVSEMVFKDPNVGGVASSYPSALVDGGK